MLNLLLACNITIEYKKRYWTTMSSLSYPVCPEVYLFLKHVFNESGENTLGSQHTNLFNYLIVRKCEKAADLPLKET